MCLLTEEILYNIYNFSSDIHMYLNTISRYLFYLPIKIQSCNFLVCLCFLFFFNKSNTLNFYQEQKTLQLLMD